MIRQGRAGATSIADNEVRSWISARLGILATFAGVGAMSVIALHLAFLWHNQASPREIANNVPVAAIVLGAVAVFVCWKLFFHRGQDEKLHFRSPDLFWARRRRWAREARLLAEENQRRAARLLADPVLKKYGLFIKRGQHWSDEQIAYDQDRLAMACCEHLQPIERAMRDAGLRVRMRYGQYVDAHCQVDAEKLKPAMPVFFTNSVPGDRPLDSESAMIACREHSSAIWVIHPDDARPDTPWFPWRD